MRAIVSSIKSVARSPSIRSAVATGVSASGAYRLLQRACGQVSGGFVLAYHNLAAARFIEHLQWLRPNRPVPLSELVERHVQAKSTAGLFAITFDDGVGDTVRSIATVVEREQWPVTFFVPTGYLEDSLGMPFQWLRAIAPHIPARPIVLRSRRLDLSAPGAVAAFTEEVTRLMYTRPRDQYVPLLMELVDFIVAQRLAEKRQLEPPAAITWDEVARLSRNPLIRFESHGVSHSALAALEPGELERELRESRDTIHEHTNVPCRHFCYPFGGTESIGGRAPREVARYYESAVTMSRGRVRRRSPYLLPRIPLYPEDDGAIARLKVLTL